MVSGLSIAAATPSDALINRITDEAFNHSEIPTTAGYLDDQIGGRMTNSPAMRNAERWTQQKFKEWGLRDVRTEGFDFGRGWWIESSHVRMTLPRIQELKGIPTAWTPATNGSLIADITVAPMASEKDFPQWQGKLAGKIVLVSYPEGPKDDAQVPFQRLADGDVTKLDKLKQPSTDPEVLRKRIERYKYRAALDKFLAEQGALATIFMSRHDGRLVHGEGYAYQVGKTPLLPALELAAEDYRKLARLAKVGTVRLDIDNHVHFEDADRNAYNVLADLPGSDSKAGYVMAGAHLDSWVAGDGAADNGAGSVMIMEAARILAKLQVKTRRTIRFALWAGEEQGLLGSAAYVDRHIAHRAVNADPALRDLPPYFTQDTFPVTTLGGFNDFTAYFNIDNGSGKLRGVYAEGNLAAVPTLREWMSPFGSLGANAVVAEPTEGTDHVFFSRLGLPAFQFVQDPLDYETRVHHTDLDTYDHLRIEDMKQAAVVLAAVLVDAANTDKPLPRKGVPTEPKVTDPYRYVEPQKP